MQLAFTELELLTRAYFHRRRRVNCSINIARHQRNTETFKEHLHWTSEIYHLQNYILNFILLRK